MITIATVCFGWLAALCRAPRRFQIERASGAAEGPTPVSQLVRAWTAAGLLAYAHDGRVDIGFPGRRGRAILTFPRSGLVGDEPCELRTRDRRLLRVVLHHAARVTGPLRCISGDDGSAVVFDGADGSLLAFGKR